MLLLLIMIITMIIILHSPIGKIHFFIFNKNIRLYLWIHSLLLIDLGIWWNKLKSARGEGTSGFLRIFCLFHRKSIRWNCRRRNPNMSKSIFFFEFLVVSDDESHSQANLKFWEIVNFTSPCKKGFCFKILDVWSQSGMQ